MTLEHKYASVNNVNIHYVESVPKPISQSPSHSEKKDAEKTIVFLHGFPEYWGTWHDQLNYFSQNYRVVAPDLPGYNLSDKPTESSFYTIPNLISFFAEFIKIISPEQTVYLVAHDWGGAIAWPLAAFHPHLISKLVILNAAHPSTFTREMVNNPLQRQYSTYIHDLISPSAESLLTKNNFHYLNEEVMKSYQTGVFTDEIKEKYRLIWRQEGAINGMLQYYRSMPQLAEKENESSNLSSLSVEPLNSESPVKNTSQMKVPNIRVNVPTLILWGELDKAFVVENLNDIEQFVPNCTISRFSNASHWLHHEKPTEVNNAIAAFISDAKHR